MQILTHPGLSELWLRLKSPFCILFSARCPGMDLCCPKAVLWRFPSPIPRGHPRLKNQTNFSNCLPTSHPPPSSATGKRATLAAGSSQTTTPSRRHTGREHVGSPCPEDVTAATPHLCTFVHAGAGRDTEIPWWHASLLKWVLQMPSILLFPGAIVQI